SPTVGDDRDRAPARAGLPHGGAERQSLGHARLRVRAWRRSLLLDLRRALRARDAVHAHLEAPLQADGRSEVGLQPREAPRAWRALDHDARRGGGRRSGALARAESPGSVLHAPPAHEPASSVRSAAALRQVRSGPEREADDGLSEEELLLLRA